MKGPFSKLRSTESGEEQPAPADDVAPTTNTPAEQPTTTADAVEPTPDDQPTSAYDSPLVAPADAAAIAFNDAPPPRRPDPEDEDGQPTIAYDGPLVPPAGEAQAAAQAAAVPAPAPASLTPAPLTPEPTAAHAPASPVAGAVPPPVPPAPTPPADTDPAQLQVAAAPSFRDRGRLRRRLTYLRRVRELGFRDLGGLVFDLHRFGRDGAALVQAKLDALAVVDRELRTLERVLQDKPQYIDLREPGIAACPRCAALHGSDARFCPNCGTRLDGPQPGGEVYPPAGAPVYQPQTQPHTIVPTPPPPTRTP